MAVSLRDTVKISEFIDLSKQDEILPAFMTKVKSIRISTVDKIMAVKNDSLSDVDFQIARGGASSYVSSYVNSLSSAPLLYRSCQIGRAHV